MTEVVCIVGESGTGKSTAIHENVELGIKGLDPKETFLINVAGKGLPFRGWKKFYLPFTGKTGNFLASEKSSTIVSALAHVAEHRKDIKNVVIDDFQYILSFEYMEKALVKEWAKFSEMAKHAYDVIHAARYMPNDVSVFFLTHSEEIQKDMVTIRKIKTIGRMLDQQITMEGLFTVLLYSGTSWDEKAKKANYFFVTNRTDEYPGKSPFGMFNNLYVPNDLGYVKDAMDKFYKGE